VGPETTGTGTTGGEGTINPEPPCTPKTWCEVMLPEGDVTLLAIWGQSLDDVWVGGAAPYRDGTEPFARRSAEGWQMFPLGLPPGNDPSVRAIWGSAPDDIWAGEIFGTVWHYDGVTWTYDITASEFTTRDFRAAWGSAANNVYLGAEGGMLLHHDGMKWSSQILFPGELDIYALGGSGPSDIWAVGEGGEAHHYDGNAWKSVPLGADHDMMSIAVVTPNDAWAGLDFSSPGLAHWDGNAWKLVTSPIKEYHRGIWPDSAADLWAVAEDGSILHYDGNTWSVDTSTGTEFRGIRRVEDTLYAVGDASVWFRRD
jgi:hypothetical protein